MTRRILLAVALMSLAATTSARAGATVNADPTAEPRRLVIIGASYAESWGTPPLPGYTVINRGVGGQQTGQMRARFQADVIEAQPAAVLIWGHINNITRSNLAGAAPERVATVLNAARSDYAAMVGAARAAGISVVLATEIPLAEPAGLLNEIRALIGRLLGKQSYSEKVNAHVRELNAFVRQLAAREKLRVLDFEKVFAPDRGARRPEYAKDDLSHVTPAGYEALTRYATLELGRGP
jgi:lysophospholipase L1-like esterase